MTPADIAEWALVLAAARRDRVGCDPISSSINLTLDDAYAIQRAGVALRMQRGENIVGWRLGYTSLAMRSQMGIDQPILVHSPMRCSWPATTRRDRH